MLLRFIALCILLTATPGIAAEERSFHSLSKMVMVDKVLELRETRQVTFREDGDVTNATISPDGRYVLYSTIVPDTDSADRHERLCVMKATGGKSVVILDGHVSDLYFPCNSNKDDWLYSWESAIWSPDSKLISIPASYEDKQKPQDKNSDQPVDTSPKSQDYMLVYSRDGSLKAQFEVPEGAFFFEWSPNSRYLAGVVNGVRDSQTHLRACSVLILDMTTGQSQTIYELSAKYLGLEKWSDDSRSLLCFELIDKKNNKYHKIYLDGRNPTEYEGSAFISHMKTDDDALKFDWPGKEKEVAIRNASNDEIICKLKLDDDYDVCMWIPHTRLLTYCRSNTLQDGHEGRSKKLKSLWIMYPQGKKLNSMCVAYDVDSSTMTSSKDHLKSAYVSNGHVFVIELESRAATPREKAAAGTPLTEEETKSLTLENARQIYDALSAYISGAEYYPSEENFAGGVGYHLRDSDALLVPGSNKPAFTYHFPGEPGKDVYPGNLKSIAETLLGSLDAGYQWQIDLYADGHTVIVQK